ncbi:MAG: hypothetical protein IJE19_01490 [Clostridia bacterium]|nr:hypothetical protein [Clostridia bacterium]
MYQDSAVDYTEIPVTEIRQQLEYAKVICEDLFNKFAVKNKEECMCGGATETKLSMLLDFIHEAISWCTLLDMNQALNEKNIKEEI